MASRARGVTLIGLLMVVSLAGCFGSDDAPEPGPRASGNDEDTTGGSATSPRAERGTGRPSVEGFVLDAANLPIPDAQVLVQNEEMATLVDDFGAYAFAGLADNQVYVIIAEAPGFKQKAQQFVAVKDQVIRLNFTLDEKPTETPFHSVVERSGLIGCQALVQIGGDHGGESDDIEQGCSTGVVNDPNAVQVLQFAIPAKVVGLVVEVEWESNQPLSDHLRAAAETYGYGDLDTEFGATIGTSPIKIDIPQDLVAKYYTGDGGGLKIRIDTSPPDDDEQAAGAAASFQQPFTVHVTQFYVTPNPPSYSVFDGPEG